MKTKKELLEIYKHSFPYVNIAWRRLVKVHRSMGQKDFYFMVLRLQKELMVKGAYALKRNPKV